MSPHHQDPVTAGLLRPAGRRQQPQLPGAPHGRGPVPDTELGVDAAGCALTVFGETDSSPAISGRDRLVGRYRSTRSSPGLSSSAGGDEDCRTAFGQAEARDRHHVRTWVVLVDGDRHQIELVQAEAGRRNAAVHLVVDLVHVLELSTGPGLLASTSSTILVFTLCHRC